MHEFQNKIRQERLKMVKILTDIKSKGKSIVGYGAPAKATTLLHYFGIADMIDYIVDDSPLKVGRFMPGNHIPIKESKTIYEDNPDYVIILAWNFAEPIIKKLHENGYRGRCIVPFK